MRRRRTSTAVDIPCGNHAGSSLSLFFFSLFSFSLFPSSTSPPPSFSRPVCGFVRLFSFSPLPVFFSKERTTLLLFSRTALHGYWRRKSRAGWNRDATKITERGESHPDQDKEPSTTYRLCLVEALGWLLEDACSRRNPPRVLECPPQVTEERRHPLLASRGEKKEEGKGTPGTARCLPDLGSAIFELRDCVRLRYASQRKSYFSRGAQEDGNITTSGNASLPCSRSWDERFRLDF
ncbi:hypothetical protein GGS23DRAFT_354750 [Durotheca rogersii]|uniref:uncharacterized protein n=1 Tax=Durotheca rogersii TaxID=419775 RepID=UPI00221EC3F6|nr:uncharacterized protein GGS23DRAFT_354750 [Durotheca rogersii]KAI5865785.1 hypothetical protein GGS23DRAFT_354750 [Durotheca rogersii]